MYQTPILFSHQGAERHTFPKASFHQQFCSQLPCDSQCKPESLEFNPKLLHKRFFLLICKHSLHGLTRVEQNDAFPQTCLGGSTLKKYIMMGWGLKKRFFKTILKISPHHLQPHVHLLKKNKITYNNVCQKLYKGLLKIKCLIQPNLNSMYVMLRNIHYTLLFYLYSLLTSSYYINFTTYHKLCYVIHPHHKKDCFLTNFEV